MMGVSIKAMSGGSSVSNRALCPPFQHLCSSPPQETSGIYPCPALWSSRLFSKMKVILMLLVVLLGLVLLVSHSQGMRHYAGMVPPNQSIDEFLNVCRVCGQWYGGEMERECIWDKTFVTFANCHNAINSRR